MERDLTTFQIDKETVERLEAIATRNKWSKQDQIRHWCELDSILQKATTAAPAIAKQAPIAGVDYDPDAPMCQDDYEYLTGTAS